jgi:hypothetical protein
MEEGDRDQGWNEDRKRERNGRQRPSTKSLLTQTRFHDLSAFGCFKNANDTAYERNREAGDSMNTEITGQEDRIMKEIQRKEYHGISAGESFLSAGRDCFLHLLSFESFSLGLTVDSGARIHSDN